MNDGSWRREFMTLHIPYHSSITFVWAPGLRAALAMGKRRRPFDRSLNWRNKHRRLGTEKC
ncbi:hypothetical protein GE21DRAFT_1291909 [Neurospora crassa]|nr:hypothetical protein GE21DRAFT_1291909 [Neurospora crassa]